MKKLLLFLPLFVTTLACNSQPAATTAAAGDKTVKVTGKIKTKILGRVYLESLNERGIATKIDSSEMKDGSFSLKTLVATPNFYQINVADQQKIILVLDGGEALTVEADGYISDENRNGNFTIKGSKAMDDFLAVNNIMSDMQKKVTKWQTDYQAASAKKNQTEMRAIEQKFETEQNQTVEKVKTLIPTMGTSLVALWATNFLNPEKDFETFDALAQKFEAAKLKYPAAQQFINMIKKKKGSDLGSEAPDFTLTDLEGKQYKLSEMKGKVVVLDFWATWCRPCIMSFPGMQKAMAKYKDNANVKFFFVDTFERVGPDAVVGHVANFTKGRAEMAGMSILMDKAGEVATSYGVNGIPAKFCIDKNGKIFKKSEGFLGSDDLIVEEIDRWVAEANK